MACEEGGERWRKGDGNWMTFEEGVGDEGRGRDDILKEERVKRIGKWMKRIRTMGDRRKGDSLGKAGEAGE